MVRMRILVGSMAVALAVLVPARARAQCCGFSDLGDGTIKDTCTGRQWEKKTTAVGSGVNPADLHDVDNRYSWAGICTVGLALCQPNAAAAVKCAAHSDGGTAGCSECASGTCDVDPARYGAITTVWDWVNQVNAANFAGHNDWRLPSEGGQNFPATGSDELETIMLTPYPCGTHPCINSLFGPTGPFYWSASADATFPPFASGVFFTDGVVSGGGKNFGGDVRAVR